MAVALNTYGLDAGLLRTVHELDTKRDFLRTVYRLAGKRVSSGISLEETRTELGIAEDAADRACDFWVREGVLRYWPPGHLALSHVGARRAERLESRRISTRLFRGRLS